MAFEMNALAGFMRLGPQVYPERPNAVQVIQRGPHGRRLAADPVAVRAGQPRGSGFRFWVEQLNVPADESWNPPQEVIGLMGLGEAPPAPDPSSAMVCSTGALPRPDFGKKPDSWSIAAVSMRKELDNVAGAACRGRVTEASKILEGAWLYFGPQMTAGERAALSPLVQTARAYITSSEPGASERLKESEAREKAYTDAVKAWGDKYGASEKKRTAEEIECAKRGEAAYAMYVATGACPRGPSFPTPDKEFWVKAAVFAAGAIVLYGFAQGAGSAIFRGR